MLKLQNLVTSVFAILLVACFLGKSSAEEIAGKQWPAAQQISIDDVDHKVFHELLQKFVDEDGHVNYKAWQASESDRKLLNDYLAHLSQANSKKPAQRDAKLAYWINAYNAVTIEGILRVYPTTSIRNHTARLIGYNIWKNLMLHVGDTKINLNDIEHEVLRKMDEPRIHFAIVCASISCPRLLNEAYVADKLEEQLVANSTDFFSRPENLRVDTNSKKIQLSAIMNWFGEDFGSGQAAQVNTVAPYFPDSAKVVVEKGSYRVGYLSYDWNLNEQK
jgi:hypothetical protein